VRVCVSAIYAAAGPCMTASVDQPLLDYYSPGLVSSYRAGIGPARGRSGLCALHAVTALGLRLDDLCGIRRMDDVIRIAVEDDSSHATGVIWGRTRFPLAALHPGVAPHCRKRGRDVGG